MNTVMNKIENNEYNLDEKETCAIFRTIDNFINKLKIIQCLNDSKEEKIIDCNNWNFAIRTLLIISEELKSQGTWKILKEILEHENKKHAEFSSLLSKIKTSEIEIERLLRQLEEERNKFQNELEDKNRCIEEQNDKLDNLTSHNDRELQFEKEWLKVQIEENDLRHELEELELQQYIKKLKLDIDEEQEVHDEVMWYYENEENNTDEITSYWLKRYKDIDEQKAELHELSEKCKKQYKELEFYKTMHTVREKEMNEYLAEKEYRRQQHEYKQYRHLKATKIQAWWRGVMVRRYLGPFKYLLKAKCSKKRKPSLKKKN